MAIHDRVMVMPATPTKASKYKRVGAAGTSEVGAGIISSVSTITVAAVANTDAVIFKGGTTEYGRFTSTRLTAAGSVTANVDGTAASPAVSVGLGVTSTGLLGSASYLGLAVGGTEYARLTSTGLGIGDAAPNGPLRVRTTTQNTVGYFYASNVGATTYGFVGLVGDNTGLGSLLGFGTHRGTALVVASYGSGTSLITRISANYAVNSGNGTTEYVVSGAKKAPGIELNADTGVVSILVENGSGGDYRTPTYTKALSVAASGNVGVNTTTPRIGFTVVQNNAYASAETAAYSSTADHCGVVALTHARGSEASPSAVQSGDTLGYLQFVGHDGTGYAGRAIVAALATQNWTPSARGTRMYFSTTANGSAGDTERLSLNQGELVINDTGADADFRVEGVSQANGLFYDAGNNRFGVLNGSPSYPLDVTGVVRANADGTAAAPSLLVGSGATNRGLFAVSSSIGVAVAGAEVARFSSTGLGVGAAAAFPCDIRGAIVGPAFPCDIRGAIVGQVNVENAPSGATATAAKSRTVYTNQGATSQALVELPAAAAGLTFTFVVRDADGLAVGAQAGDLIRIDASTSTTGGTASSSTIGDVLELIALDATEWHARAVRGTWVLT